MTCKHENSVPLVNYIVAKPQENLIVGLVFTSTPRQESDDIIILDGRYLSCNDFPELYSEIGDAYCPKMVKASRFFGLLEKLMVLVGVPWHKLQKDVPNPLYKDGLFRIPSMHINRQRA